MVKYCNMHMPMMNVLLDRFEHDLIVLSLGQQVRKHKDFPVRVFAQLNRVTVLNKFDKH